MVNEHRHVYHREWIYASYNIILSDLTCKTIHVKVLFILLSNKVLLLLPRTTISEPSSRKKLFPCRLIIIIICYIAHVCYSTHSHIHYSAVIVLRRFFLSNYSMVIGRLYNDSYAHYDFFKGVGFDFGDPK